MGESNGMEFVTINQQMHPQYVLTGKELSQSFTAYVAGKLILLPSLLIRVSYEVVFASW